MATMLSSIWTTSRATEDSDNNSINSWQTGRSRGSHHSRPGEIVMDTVNPHAEVAGQDVIEGTKMKAEIDEAQIPGTLHEDRRPDVFKSTRWEICAVAALVCAQLTNVGSLDYPC